MEAIAVFLLLLSVVETFTQQVIDPIVEQKISSRIVNGQVAQDHQFPYMVGLKFINASHTESFCGGALINYEWVLTAAHCIDKQISVTVYAGSIRRQGGQVRHVVSSNMIIPNENVNISGHDIGLIKLMPPVRHSLAIVPIALPRAGFHNDINSIGVIAGWGYTHTNGPLSDNLLYTDARVITNDHCQKYQGFEYIDNTLLCTLPSSGGAPCFGDSGSPLVLRTSEVLIGISSFRRSDDCLSGLPDGYTRIIPYLQWIQHYTGIQT